MQSGLTWHEPEPVQYNSCPYTCNSPKKVTTKSGLFQEMTDTLDPVITRTLVG